MGKCTFRFVALNVGYPEKESNRAYSVWFIAHPYAFSRVSHIHHRVNGRTNEWNKSLMTSSLPLATAAPVVVIARGKARWFSILRESMRSLTVRGRVRMLQGAITFCVAFENTVRPSTFQDFADILV